MDPRCMFGHHEWARKPYEWERCVRCGEPNPAWRGPAPELDVTRP